MTPASPERDPVELLAEEFLERLRRGEQPSLTEYADRHPELAGRVRRLFPALILLEQFGRHEETPPSPTDLDRLGEYRILREVGRGGMGVVFEAVQESLGRRVALKVLPRALCRDRYLERFRREAMAAARLHHTNIVPVFGAGEEAGTHFFVMQFIDGRGLDDVIREARRLRAAEPSQDEGLHGLAQCLLSGRFTGSTLQAETDPPSAAAPPDAPPAPGCSDEAHHRAVARLGLQAAEALHHAHQQGVLHRDVKPSNLLLDTHGTLWVADFGLAKADDFDDLTDTGDLVGTLRYMAPEQMQGRCDARSDVYGLGVTLYELLAMRPAFAGPGRLRLMGQVANGDAPRLRRLVPGLHPDLEVVVAKAMARDAADRYRSAQELADDLGRFLSDRPVTARRPAALEQLARWCRRRPAVAALSAVVAALLLAGAVGGWWASARLGQQVEAVTRAEQRTKERLWEARLAQARAGRASRLPGQRFNSLEAVAEAARIRPSPELRNEAIACLPLADVRTEREWDAELETDRLQYSTGVAFDPSLRFHACTGADGMVSVRATADNQLVARLAGAGGPADFLRFSSDSRYLAAGFTGTGHCPYRVWDWRDGKVVFDRTKSPTLLSLDFLADGRSVVLGGNRALERIELPTGVSLGRSPLDIDPGWVAARPDGSDLVAVCSRAGSGRAGKLRVVDLASGRTVSRWDELPTGLVAVAWQPGGTLLAASGRDGNIYTFRLDDPSPPAVLRGHLLEARELAFSPDGTLLVSRGWDGTTRFWDPVGGREVLRARGASFLQFDPEGRRLAYRGYNTRRLGVWELPDRSVCRVLQGYRGRQPLAHAGASFSRDGGLLAVCAGGEVCLWDSRSGRLLGRVETGPVNDVLFDPAGRFLYTAGGRGFLAYPLERTLDNGLVCWRVGRPRHAANWLGGVNAFRLHADRAGDRLAVVERFNRVLVLPRPGDAGRPAMLAGHAEVSFAELSPDGRHVATGTWRGKGVKVWSVSTGRLVKDLPARESAGVGFTPDGSRLLVLESEGTYRCHRVGSWELLWERGDPDTGFTRGLRAAFHPGGQVMAHVRDRVSPRLVGLETGEELAVLPVPESENLSGYQFSPDGRYLAAVTIRGAVQLWNLPRLRAALRAAGLDWDTSALPGEPDESAAAPQVAVQVSPR